LIGSADQRLGWERVAPYHAPAVRLRRNILSDGYLPLLARLTASTISRRASRVLSFPLMPSESMLSDIAIRAAILRENRHRLNAFTTQRETYSQWQLLLLLVHRDVVGLVALDLVLRVILLALCICPF
jgi:hypothetical protein